MDNNTIIVKGHGVIYFLENSGIIGKKNICDIAPDPGVKIVNFYDVVDSMVIDSVNIPDSGLSFPDVEEIHIDKCIKEIHISNKMFPNVKKVVSKSSFFRDNTNVLIWHKYGKNNILLNTFCKQEGELIDLDGVNSLWDYSFDGCLSTNIINVANNMFLTSQFLENCKLKIDESTEAKMFSNILVEVDPNAEVAEIPDDRYNLRFNASLKFTNKAVKIHKYSTLKKLRVFEIPSKLIIDSAEGIKTGVEFNLSHPSVSYIEVNDDNKAYSSIDGILYSKNKKALVSCPAKRTGEIFVPDGVESIATKAFMKSEISTVVLPKSLKYIGDMAFKDCKVLNNVQLNEGLENIGYKSFSGCVSLEHIDFPSTVKDIDDGCFCYCNLIDVVIPDSMSVINNGSFAMTGGTIVLPASIEIVKNNNFGPAKTIQLKGKMPYGLIESLLTSRDYKDDIITEICSSDNTLYMPRVDMKNDVYSWNWYVESLPFDIMCKEMPYVYLTNIINEEDEESVALIIYEKTGSPQIKTVLINLSLKFAQRLIKENDEAMFIRLIKAGVLTKSQLNMFLHKTQECNMPAATAYILSEINKIENTESLTI